MLRIPYAMSSEQLLYLSVMIKVMVDGGTYENLSHVSHCHVSCLFNSLNLRELSKNLLKMITPPLHAIHALLRSVSLSTGLVCHKTYTT